MFSCRVFSYKIIQLDQNDLTDIHLAIQVGNTSTIEKLVSEGADLNVQSSDGQTCLHRAIKLCYKGEKIMHDTDTLKEVSCTSVTQTRPKQDRRESEQPITLRPTIGQFWSLHGVLEVLAVSQIYAARSSRSLVYPKI